jgi:hypothetical protein
MKRMARIEPVSNVREGRLMGRAKLKISEALVGVALVHGLKASKPEPQLADVRIIDARMRTDIGLIELLLESPNLEAQGELTLDNAPDFYPTFRRTPWLEEDAALELVTAHLQSVAFGCTCANGGPENGLFCTACRSKKALRGVPVDMLDRARATAALEAPSVAAADPDSRHGEVPGT